MTPQKYNENHSMPSAHILTSKLYIPQTRPDAVYRSHLVQRLNDGLASGRQMTLVSAPAGFGKTTCISIWVNSLDIPFEWLALDSQDDEPQRFFSYLIAVLQQIDENLGWEIEGILRSGQLPPEDIISATLINDILQIEYPFVLVIDDFQVIQSPAILNLFEQLLASTPPSLHLVLISREDPVLPLAKMRASNQLTEIRAADLRFTQDEAGEFMNSTMDLSLTTSDIALLENKTEGWAVGLQLAALAMQQASVNPSRFIANLSGNHRHILSYLTEEVLNQQSNTIQQFLLQTSILNRLTGELCNAVTLRSDAQSILEDLFNRNLFVFPLDDNQNWYRYHQLFADLLRDMQNRYYHDESTILHQRASRWYAQAGMIDEAIQHALVGKDETFTLELFATHAITRLMQWDLNTVETWLQRIPIEWQIKSFETNFAAAWMYLFRGDIQQALAYIERCSTLMRETDSLINAKWLTLQCMLSNAQGKVTDSLKIIEQALDIVPEQESELRSLIYLGQAGAYQQLDDYEQTIAAFQNIITHGKASASILSELLGLSGMVLMAMHRGYLHFAFEASSQGEEQIERSSVLLPISTGIYGELGKIYYDWDQLEQAHHYFKRSIQVSTLSGISDAEIFYAVIRSRLFEREEDIDAAAEEIQRAIDLSRKVAPAAVREEIISQQIRIYLAQDHLAAAENLLHAEGYGFEDPISFPEIASLQSNTHPEGLLYNAALRILLYRGQVKHETEKLKQGIELAKRFIENTLERHYLPVALEALLIRAKMYHHLGKLEASLNDYTHALRLGEAENFISSFVDEGQAVAKALLILSKQQIGVNNSYINTILAAFRKFQSSQATSSMIEALTDREMDVLRLMAEGLKYQEIADRLFISLNTVRFYVKEIYSKLAVNNRTQALESARQQKLL